MWTTATLWISDDGSLIRGSWCSSNCECDLWPIRVYKSLLKTAVCNPCRNWLPGSPWAKKCLGRAPSPRGKELTSCSAFYSRCCPGVGYGWVAPFLSFISPVCSALHSCLTLCDPMDCSPPGSSVHGSPQAGILEWVAISSSRGSSWCRGQTQVSCISCIGRQILYPFHFIIHVKVLCGLTVICDPLLLLSPPQAPGLSNYPINLHLCHGLKGAFAWEMLSSLPLRQIKTLLWIEALQGQLLCLVTLRTHWPIQQGLGENGYWKGLEMLLVQTEISYKCKIHPWFWRSSRKKKSCKIDHYFILILCWNDHILNMLFWKNSNTSHVISL